jgi:predicted RNA-binding Zn-ribbon protein involved in translation (DUF1610 family)
MLLPSCPTCSSTLISTSGQDLLECPNCHAAWLVCDACQQINSADRETCSSCGEPLAMLDRVLDRLKSDSQPRWLREARSRAEMIKEAEANASEQRLEELRRIDEERIRAQEAQERQTKAQERRMLSAALLTAAVIILGAIVVVVAIALQG